MHLLTIPLQLHESGNKMPILLISRTHTHIYIYKLSKTLFSLLLPDNLSMYAVQCFGDLVIPYIVQ